MAGRVLVPARTEEDNVGVFLLDTGAQGVSVEREDTTSGIPEARIELSGAVVAHQDVLGDPAGGAAIVAWMVGSSSVSMACSVSMSPGMMTLTVTPSGPTSRARTRLNPMTPALPVV